VPNINTEVIPVDPKKTVRLILGDQLNEQHSWFQQVSDEVTYVLMEVRQETDYVEHHIQKVAGIFAAMRNFASVLEKKGHQVLYLPLDDPENGQTFEHNLKRLIRTHGFDCLEYQLPDEYRLDRQLRELGGGLSIPVRAVDTEHFLTEREEVKKFFEGKKRYLMESFYRGMRRKHGVLMEDGDPIGGRWNYDQENRNPYDDAVKIPEPKLFANDVRELTAMIEEAGVRTFGQIEPRRYVWPVSRSQALELLDDFLRNGLPWFGVYQDAMTRDSWTLFHSRLSFALNTKMLHPMEVIRAALDYANDGRTREVDLASLEGFVRQILGWREYMRGLYWSLMPEYEGMNFLSHRAPLPGYYWTGNTRMNCMAHAIGQSLNHAYAHHIQRLMVTGNFALLAGVHPDEVDAWYLGVYIDAIQWVEIVNTRGMSQFADGGIVATKPYISSANYIRKMSDYCQTCSYSASRKTGPGACPFNSLYWEFLHRHRNRLAGNPRVAMVYRTLDRMNAENRDGILAQARKYRDNLEEL
jgi:deoxyribodipyrimidine photolyase-related protein